MNTTGMSMTGLPALALLSLLLVAAAAAAQDAASTLPDSYRVQFENAQVRVVRALYPAGAKLPDHTHPAGTTLYVYLNDADGIVFRHSGRMNHVVKRPPVKAGSMRIATGPEEHHTAENTSASPAAQLRIQLKTVKDARARQRIPAATFSGATSSADEYTSDAFVIQRVFIASGQSISAEPVGAPAPSLWIALPSGETRWAEAVDKEPLVNDGTLPMEWLRVIVR